MGAKGQCDVQHFAGTEERLRRHSEILEPLEKDDVVVGARRGVGVGRARSVQGHHRARGRRALEDNVSPGVGSRCPTRSTVDRHVFLALLGEYEAPKHQAKRENERGDEKVSGNPWHV